MWNTNFIITMVMRLWITVFTTLNPGLPKRAVAILVIDDAPRAAKFLVETGVTTAVVSAAEEDAVKASWAFDTGVSPGLSFKLLSSFHPPLRRLSIT
jgi:hypothetical protein